MLHDTVLSRPISVVSRILQLQFVITTLVTKIRQHDVINGS